MVRKLHFQLVGNTLHRARSASCPMPGSKPPLLRWNSAKRAWSVTRLSFFRDFTRWSWEALRDLAGASRSASRRALLAPPKRGETELPKITHSRDTVSIHSPRRSEGRPLLCGRSNSRRFASKLNGELGSHGSAKAYKFQSTPPAEARGDPEPSLVRVSIHSPREAREQTSSADSSDHPFGFKFQSTPPAEARGDSTRPCAADACKDEGRGLARFNPLPPPKRGETSNSRRSALAQYIGFNPLPPPKRGETTLWQVGQSGREKALKLGVRTWHGSDCTPEAVGVSGKTRGPTLQAILDVNRGSGPPVRPVQIWANNEHWRMPAPVEFFVDFETVTIWLTT